MNSIQVVAVILGTAILPIPLAAQSDQDRGSPPPPFVRWRDWSADSFALARRENRPILINVAAAWCHWCHVMDQQTFADPDVARLLNERFVAIRVDADGRPDVAERYAEWGWPADAILTPAAQAVTERRGFQARDEFLALLRETIRDLDAGRLVGRRDAPRAAIDPRADLSRVRAEVAGALDGFFDAELGGWGRRQKYPLAAPIEELLFRAAGGDPSAAGARDRAWQTLRAEARLIDPVFGGMYQYSVPDDWDHPHFEKLAAIQAGALEGFAAAHVATRDALWKARGEDIRRYVTAFLTAPDGAFYATQDADLGTHPGDSTPFLDGHDYYRLDLAGRRQRGIPHVDDHIYADANGQLIHAFVCWYEATGDGTALAAAQRAAERLIATHGLTSGGMGHGGKGAGELLHLADQAWVGRAWLRLFEATGEVVWLERARAIAATLRASLRDDETGAFFAHSVDPAAAGEFAARRRPLIPNAVAARFLVRLGRVVGDEALVAAGERCVRAFAPAPVWREEGRFIGEYLLALDELLGPWVHVAFTGRRGDPRADALVDAVRARHDPRVIVDRRPPEGVTTVEPAAFICTMNSCSPPIDDAAAIGPALDSALRRDAK